jgi:hypothetical protein
MARPLLEFPVLNAAEIAVRLSFTSARTGATKASIMLKNTHQPLFFIDSPLGTIAKAVE